MIIISQDRAQGFYEKCGYVLNEKLTPASVLPDGFKPPKLKDVHPSGFVPDFTTVMVEKYLD